MSAEVFSHLSLSAFQQPRRQHAEGAWKGHIPFAFWCIEWFRPQVLVELGTHVGDSYFACCQAVETYATATRCFAVDTWQGDPHSGDYDDEIYNDVKSHNLEHYSAFSSLMRMKFDDALEQFSDGSIDLLHIDGFHTYGAVRHDFDTWLPKMSRRGVLLFHDSNVFEDGFGVWQLMRELEQRFAHFHFLHCNGLSMFTLSDESPADARWMTSLSPSESDIWRHIFARLGNWAIQEATPAPDPSLRAHAIRSFQARFLNKR